MLEENIVVSRSTPSLALFYLSFVPLLGGLAIVRTASQLRDRKFVQLGWAIFAISLVMALGESLVLAWLVQIGLALWFRAQHSRPEPLPPPSKIDFNNCSKHELVRLLGLPIVYANDIEIARTEGYIFTHVEELTEIAGLPEAQARRIGSQIIFSYDETKHGADSWRRLNILSTSELQAFGVAEAAAEKIVEERSLNGEYRSAIEVKRRTGLPLRTYQRLL